MTQGKYVVSFLLSKQMLISGWISITLKKLQKFNVQDDYNCMLLVNDYK